MFLISYILYIGIRGKNLYYFKPNILQTVYADIVRSCVEKVIHKFSTLRGRLETLVKILVTFLPLGFCSGRIISVGLRR